MSIRSISATNTISRGSCFTRCSYFNTCITYIVTAQSLTNQTEPSQTLTQNENASKIQQRFCVIHWLIFHQVKLEQ